MDTFTLVTGLASLLGFAIQVFDLFPRFGRARHTAFLVLVGIFIGSVLRAIDPAGIRISYEITGHTVVAAIFVVVITGFLVAAAFTHDGEKRGEFYGVASIGFFVFIFVLIIGAMPSLDVDSSVEKERITITELNGLVDRAVRNKDFDRALMHLKTIKHRINYDDPRTKLIDDRIREIELQELK